MGEGDHGGGEVIDLSRSRKKPYAHQVVGVQALVDLVDPEKGRTIPGIFWLGDQMRMGKSAQVINAAQVLYEQKLLDVVIVVSPASVRDVWYHPTMGEIQKHRWLGLPTLVTQFHSVTKKWFADAEHGQRYLLWIVTNYEFIRYGLKRRSTGWTSPYLENLFKVCGQKTMLVLDESAEVASYDSLQTRACMALRRRCGRVVLLNGTPIVENPEDLYSQAKVLDPRIFGLEHVSQFRNKYAIMGGYMVEVMKYGRKIKVPTEILGWRHKPRTDCCDVPPHIQASVHSSGPGLEDIQKRLAPYILMRLRKDCLDLPPKLEPVTLTAVLKPETWKHYREMRDTLVTWLDKQTVAVAAQAGNKVMRLAQLTAGFLGGLRDEAAACPECGGSGEVQATLQGDPVALPSGPNLVPDGEGACPACFGTGTVSAAVPPREVGREKLDLYLGWVKRRLKEEPEMRMLTWCRFQPEAHRTILELAKIKGLTVRGIYGGQKREERLEGLNLMHPDNVYRGAADLVGTLGTGARGINMAGAHEVVYMSNAPSLMIRNQSEDRPHGPGQTQPISYHDIVAVGPKGQQTVDHVVLEALRNKDDLARWTCSAWIKALTVE